MTESFVIFNQSVSGADASSVSFAPAGTIAASDVQAAIVEVNEQILVNPTVTGLLTTPALRLSSTAIIVSNTAPTLRSDGSALVAGDFWYKPIDNGAASTAGLWLWRSPYWLSSSVYVASPAIDSGGASYSANTTMRLASNHTTATIWVEQLITTATVLNTADLSNYWTIAIVGLAMSFPSATVNLTSVGTATTTVSLQYAQGNFNFIGANVTKVGTPGNLQSLAIRFLLRNVHP